MSTNDKKILEILMKLEKNQKEMAEEMRLGFDNLNSRINHLSEIVDETNRGVAVGFENTHHLINGVKEIANDVDRHEVSIDSIEEKLKLQEQHTYRVRTELQKMKRTVNELKTQNGD